MMITTEKGKNKPPSWSTSIPNPDVTPAYSRTTSRFNPHLNENMIITGENDPPHLPGWAQTWSLQVKMTPSELVHYHTNPHVTSICSRTVSRLLSTPEHRHDYYRWEQHLFHQINISSLTCTTASPQTGLLCKDKLARNGCNSEHGCFVTATILFCSIKVPHQHTTGHTHTHTQTHTHTHKQYSYMTKSLSTLFHCWILHSCSRWLELYRWMKMFEVWQQTLYHSTDVTGNTEPYPLFILPAQRRYDQASQPPVNVENTYSYLKS